MKTLKDINEKLEFGFNFSIEQISILKQEAVKWIKKLEEEKQFLETDLETECYGKIIILKHFFNIEESDLK